MKKLFLALRDWWYARQRQADIELLWPSCKRQARDLEHAKLAFTSHAYAEPCWLALGHDGIFKAIDELK